MVSGDKTTKDRKYKSFLIVFFVSAMALAFDKMTGRQWVDLTIFCFGLWMGGNVGEHATEAFKSKAKKDKDDGVD